MEHAMELAKMIVRELADHVTISTPPEGTTDYASITCRCDSGHKYVINVVQMDTSDGIEDPSSDCISGSVTRSGD